MNVLITAGVVKAHYKDDLYISKKRSNDYLSKLDQDLSCIWGISTTLIDFDDYDMFTFEKYRNYLLLSIHNYDAIIMGADIIDPDNLSLDIKLQRELKTISPRTKLFSTIKANSTDTLSVVTDKAHKQALDTKASAVIVLYNTLGHEIVLKEKAVLQPHDKWGTFVGQLSGLINDTFYTTEESKNASIPTEEYLRIKKIIEEHKSSFTEDSSGYIFGTVALRSAKGGFLTTGRGKKELDDIVWVTKVDDTFRTVYATTGKATLNSPLLNYLFKRWEDVEYIVHTHNINKELPHYVYAPPGSVRDSIRDYVTHASFVIEAHGSYILYTSDGKVL